MRVRGDGMIDAGILDGDLPVHKTQQRPTVKSWWLELIASSVFSARANVTKCYCCRKLSYEPIEVDLAEQSFAIEGLSVGVIRQQI